MKIVLFGGNGTVGKNICRLLKEERCEVIVVGKNSGDFRANIEDRKSISETYRKIGSFDAVVSAVGEVAFMPLQELGAEHWQQSLGSKLMGQISLVQEALPYIRDNGSFTLISGILGEQFIRAGVAASMVNSALEGFVRAAACELERGIRINVVSPSLLQDSNKIYGPYFPGFEPVTGRAVALAFKKSIFGVQTGTVFKVH